jgi:hypothetical protein
MLDQNPISNAHFPSHASRLIPKDISIWTIHVYTTYIPIVIWCAFAKKIKLIYTYI